MKCNYCRSSCIKKGKRNGIQKYCCSTCKKYQQSNYKYKRCTITEEQLIVKMNNRSSGVSDIAYVTGLSKTTVVRKIRRISDQIIKPRFLENGQKYEMDEMRVIVKRKENEYPLYLIYALNRKTKQVIDFVIGRRTTENIEKITNKLLQLNPLRIYTDRLNVYPKLIKKEIHSTIFYQTNHIERFNLTLRTHLKRLANKTICYSKTVIMLEAAIKLYLWR